MHATQTPTLSQPRAGGARILGAALALAAAFTAGAVLAVNLPPLSIGTTATTAGPGIHSVEWLRNHHRGASASEVTAAQRALTELRRGEIGALGAPGAVRAQQTPAQSTLDYWRAYADQRIVSDPKAGASFMGGVPGYVLNESYRNSVTPLGVPSVQDPMGYWNSVTLRGGLLPTTSNDVYIPSIVSGEAPASVLDAIRAGAVANGYIPSIVLPVERSSEPDSMSYWNSRGLSGQGAPFVPSIVAGEAPASVLDSIRAGAVDNGYIPSIVLPAPASVYPGKVVDPVSRTQGFAPLAGDWILTAPSPFAAPYMPKAASVAPPAGDWILTAPSPFAAPYMPKLEAQGIDHPTLPAGHAKAPTSAAGNDTARGTAHR